MDVVINKTIVAATVIKVAKTYLLVTFDGMTGICHISQVSDYLVKDLGGLFKVGETYDFLIVNSNGFGQYELSFKKIHPKFLKRHSNVIETPSGFENLKKDLDERLKRV